MNDSETTALGLPFADLKVVIVSYVKALAKVVFQEPMADPLRSWAESGCDFLQHKKLMADQLVNEIGSGKRFDRLKANKATLFLQHLRKVWIVEQWVSFRLMKNEITEDHWNELGLAYFTDETASEIITHTFPELGDFTKKQFEDFRKKYGLEQVPLAHRRSGVLLNDMLTITRIGRKRV